MSFPPTPSLSHTHTNHHKSSKSKWMATHLDLIRPHKIEHEIRWLSKKKLVTKILLSGKFKVHLESILRGHLDGTSSKIKALHRLKLRVVSADQLEAAHQEALLSLTREKGGSSSRYPSVVSPFVSGVRIINDLINEYRYNEEERQARCKLASLYRLIDRMGWTQLIFNHISLRAPGKYEHFLLNAFGLHYSEVTASNLVKIDIEGNVIDPGSTQLGISKAGYTIHSAIHSARKDLKCIIHVHTAAGAAVSAMKCGLLPLCQEAMTFGPISYHTYNGIVVDESEKASLVADLGPVNKVMILHNHGILAMGKTVEEAFVTCFNVVRACETQVMAFSIGAQNLITVNDDIARKVMQVAISSGGGVSCHDDFGTGELEFEAMMRILDSLGYNTGYPYKANKLLSSAMREERRTTQNEHNYSPTDYSMTNKDKHVVNGHSQSTVEMTYNNSIHFSNAPPLPSTLPPTTLPSSSLPSLPLTSSSLPLTSSSLPSLPLPLSLLPTTLPPSLPPTTLPPSLPLSLLPTTLPSSQNISHHSSSHFPFSYPPPPSLHTSTGYYAVIPSSIGMTHTNGTGINVPFSTANSTGINHSTSMGMSLPTSMGVSHYTSMGTSVPAHTGTTSMGMNLPNSMGISHTTGMSLPTSIGMNSSHSKQTSNWDFLDERIADSSPIGFRKTNKTKATPISYTPMFSQSPINQPVVTPMYQQTSQPMVITSMHHQPTNQPVTIPMYQPRVVASVSHTMTTPPKATSLPASHPVKTTPMYQPMAPMSYTMTIPPTSLPASRPVTTTPMYQPTASMSHTMTIPPTSLPASRPVTTTPMYHQPTSQLTSSLKTNKEKSPERVQFNPTVTYNDESPPPTQHNSSIKHQTALNNSSSSSSSLSSLSKGSIDPGRVSRHKEEIKQRINNKTHDHSSSPSDDRKTLTESHTLNHTSSSSSSSSASLLLPPAINNTPNVPLHDNTSLITNNELTGLEKVMRTAEQVAQSTGASVEKLSKSLSLPPNDSI